MDVDRRLALALRLGVVALAACLGPVGPAVEAWAQACQHGTSVFKTCSSPRRSCLDNASCDDLNPCTEDLCPTQLSDTTDCTLSLGHNDDCGDTTRIDEALDVQDFGGDDVRVPAAGNLPISGVFGNAVCCPGPLFPCFVGPAGSNAMIPALETGCGDLALPGAGTPGLVTVRQNTYVVQPDDPDPLPDQANFRIRDRCDQQIQGCSTGLSTVQFTAATDTQGCSNLNSESSTPCPDVDEDPCTTAGCDGQGMCNQSHILCTTTSTSSSSTSSSSSSTTTSSSSTTSSSAPPPDCGNGTVDPGETCHPPGAPQPPNGNLCREDCTYCGDGLLNDAETCDDGNDVNGQCPANPDACRNDCTKLICKDPARIRFRPAPLPDEFKVHALIDPVPTFDPSATTVRVELRNANGVIYAATLAPGDIPAQSASSFKLRNRDARTSGGFALFHIIKRTTRMSSITFKTYGDLSAATLSRMTLTVTIGNEEFRADGNWKQLPNGWRLPLNLSQVP